MTKAPTASGANAAVHGRTCTFASAAAPRIAASACGWAGFTAARRGYDAMIREKGA